MFIRIDRLNVCVIASVLNYTHSNTHFVYIDWFSTHPKQTGGYFECVCTVIDSLSTWSIPTDLNDPFRWFDTHMTLGCLTQIITHHSCDQHSKPAT